MSQQPPKAILVTSKFELVVNALQERCSWLPVKDLLIVNGLKPGSGWADLIARAEQGDADGVKISGLIRSFFWEYVVAGKRHVQLYSLAPDSWLPIKAQLVAAQVPLSAFTALYPLGLNQANLMLAPTDQTLCEIRALGGDDVQLVFCSSRSFEEAFTLERNTSPAVMAAVDQAVKGYDRLVAYKQQWIQAFDVITFRPSLDRVEIALDLNNRGSSFDGNAMALKLLAAVKQLLSAIEPIYAGQLPINLFSAIGEIYKSRGSSELHIIDANFRTPSGAINRGKMPSTEVDLREEPFHKSGAEAVKKEIRVGGIVVAWTFKYPTGKARTKLWTRLTVSAAQDPVLHDMELSEASRDSDVAQACTKIIKYL